MKRHIFKTICFFSVIPFFSAQAEGSSKRHVKTRNVHELSVQEQQEPSRGAWLPEPTEEGKEATVGECFMKVNRSEWAKKKTREIFLERVSEKDILTGWARFSFDEKTGLPVEGFSLCKSGDYGPVKVETLILGDLQRIRYSCGGNFKSIKGNAEIVFNRKTKQVEHMKIDMRSAYLNPLVFYAPAFTPSFLVHSGPWKYKLQNFSCTSPNYKGENFVITDGIEALAKQTGTSSLQIEHGVLESYKYQKAESAKDADRLWEKAWDEREKALNAR